MRKRTELFVDAGGRNRSPEKAQKKTENTKREMGRGEDGLSFSSSSMPSFSLTGTAQKVAKKVRKIGGGLSSSASSLSSSGRASNASSSSSRYSTVSSAYGYSSRGNSSRHYGSKLAEQVIDEDEIVMEAARANSINNNKNDDDDDDCDDDDDDAPSMGHGGVGLVSGLRSALPKVPAFLGKIVDMNHKDYARVTKTSTIQRRTTSSEGLMFANRAAASAAADGSDEVQTQVSRGDSTHSNGSSSFSFFTTPRRMFSSTYTGGNGNSHGAASGRASMRRGASRKSSADVASAWVCFGPNDDVSGQVSSPPGTAYMMNGGGGGAKTNGNHSGPALTDDQEYENLIQQLRRDLRMSNERLAAVTRDLDHHKEMRRQRQTDTEVDEMKREQHDAQVEELHAEIVRLRAERKRDQHGAAHLASARAELDALRTQHARLESELGDAVRTAEKASGRVEELELELRVYKSVADETSDFHDKDVKTLLAIATKEVQKHLLQVRSNSTKAKQRSVLRQFQSRYHPDKNPVLQPLFEEIFKMIATEARMMCLDI